MSTAIRCACDWPGCSGQCHTGDTCPCHPADPLDVPENPQPRTWSATPVNDRKVWIAATLAAGVVLALLVWVSR